MADRIGEVDGADAYIAAAVLVPVLTGADAGVLLTKRTSHLNRHAGQVSFPGGRIDPTDATPEFAALRESREEIALDPELVEIIGRLPDYRTGTGYRMTPVVGALPEGHQLGTLGLSLSPHEVEAVFVLPLAVLLDPAAPQRRRVKFRDAIWRDVWTWPHPEHEIWGATAAILVGLAARLRQQD